MQAIADDLAAGNEHIPHQVAVAAENPPVDRVPRLRAGVKRISMNEHNDKIADIARQMGAELVRRPT